MTVRWLLDDRGGYDDPVIAGTTNLLLSGKQIRRMSQKLTGPSFVIVLANCLQKRINQNKDQLYKDAEVSGKPLY